MIADSHTIGMLSGAPASFRLAARAALRLKYGALQVTLPDGRRLRFEGAQPGEEAALQVYDWRMARRILSSGALGFAEGYIEKQWDTDDVAAVLSMFSVNIDAMDKELAGNKFVRALHFLQHMLRRNSKRGSQKNIYAHYDLGNSFYRQWLDPSMTYSSALYATPDEPLERAQESKYRAMADQLQLTDNDHVLEIGCGWGGFAEYAAAHRGAKVTAITISKAQHDYAQKRMFEKQLSHKVDVRLVDYRDVEGRFDKVASIEMFEAVGEKYWPGFFGKVRDVLKPGGLGSLQIITIREDLFASYRRQVDFIQRYIFPGGMLPSVSRFYQEVAQAGLTSGEARMFGGDYATTLREWRKSFEAAWDDIRAANGAFDERFRRLWSYYLAYCEAGFATGRIDVGQFQLSRT